RAPLPPRLHRQVVGGEPGPQQVLPQLPRAGPTLAGGAWWMSVWLVGVSWLGGLRGINSRPSVMAVVGRCLIWFPFCCFKFKNFPFVIFSTATTDPLCGPS